MQAMMFCTISLYSQKHLGYRSEVFQTVLWNLALLYPFTILSIVTPFIVLLHILSVGMHLGQGPNRRICVYKSLVTFIIHYTVLGVSYDWEHAIALKTRRIFFKTTAIYLATQWSTPPTLSYSIKEKGMHIDLYN